MAIELLSQKNRVNASDKVKGQIMATGKHVVVMLAMGFTAPVSQVLETLGVEQDNRGNVKATTDGENCYRTSKPKVFAAGNMRRGQSLVV